MRANRDSPHGSIDHIGRIEMTPILLPIPRQSCFTSGQYPVRKVEGISLVGQATESVRRVAEILRLRVKERFGRDWPVVPSGTGEIILGIEPIKVVKEQGYVLEIQGAGIQIEAHDESGLFYGICTLLQIMDQAGERMPYTSITDWPDYPARGVMLDISRDKVPTMETLFNLVDLLAGWKINQLQLYMEHTFAYQGHPEVWAQASPVTGEEVRELDSYCQERYIELVPNQNSFGHLNRWLVHERYAPLAEVKEGYEAPWGRENGPFSLCPVDPESLVFINSLHDELLPHFSSLKLNVGCDETYDLGQGRSKEHCEQKGRGRVYLNFLLEVYAGVKRRGRTMMYWSDMVQEHPELLPYLPKDAIALVWGYEADHPYSRSCALFQAAGIPFYVCPGTSAWSSIAGRSDNALRNLLNAAENGIRYEAIGYLITDWGDNGHWQPLPVSYLGFAAGAAYSWAIESNREIDIPRVLDQHAYHDRAGLMGRLSYQLGNIYQSAEIDWANSSVLSAILQRPLERLGKHQKIQKIPFEKVLNAIDTVMQPLEAGELDLAPRPGHLPELYIREFEMAARLLRHACWRGMLAVCLYGNEEANTHGEGPALEYRIRLHEELYQDLLGIIGEYEQVWLARNRPGGLVDSVGRLELLLKDYCIEELG